MFAFICFSISNNAFSPTEASAGSFGSAGAGRGTTPAPAPGGKKPAPGSGLPPEGPVPRTSPGLPPVGPVLGTACSPPEGPLHAPGLPPEGLSREQPLQWRRRLALRQGCPPHLERRGQEPSLRPSRCPSWSLLRPCALTRDWALAPLPPDVQTIELTRPCLSPPQTLASAHPVRTPWFWQEGAMKRRAK